MAKGKKDDKKETTQSGEKTESPIEYPAKKDVYSYHPETREYTGVTIAFQSPLEPFVYHVPANSTEIEPPEQKDKQIRVFKDGKWSYEADKSQIHEPLSEEGKAREIRNQRGFKLMASDWTQLPDSPLQPKQQTEWAKYRKELRDITKQKNFPNEVKWPEEPK